MGGGQWLDVADGKLPTFDKSEFIVDFCLIGHFIGKLYGVLVTARPELNRWDEVKNISQCGVCR